MVFSPARLNDGGGGGPTDTPERGGCSLFRMPRLLLVYLPANLFSREGAKGDGQPSSPIWYVVLFPPPPLLKETTGCVRCGMTMQDRTLDPDSR